MICGGDAAEAGEKGPTVGYVAHQIHDGTARATC